MLKRKDWIKLFMKNYIYKFLNYKNEIIYIGKTKNINNRIKQHFTITTNYINSNDSNKNIKIFSGHLPDECYQNVKRILVATVENQLTAELYETYFINKYKPKYNTDKLYNEHFSTPIEFDGIVWKELFINSYYPLIYSFQKKDIYHTGFSPKEKCLDILNKNIEILKFNSGRFPNILNKDKLLDLYKSCSSHINTDLSIYEIPIIENEDNGLYVCIDTKFSKEVEQKYDNDFFKTLIDTSIAWLGAENELYLKECA